MVIGDGARFIGDISATSVVLEGELTGNIDAREKVELGSSSRMKGSIRANRIAIQEGALFEGKVSDYSLNPPDSHPTSVPVE